MHSKSSRRTYVVRHDIFFFCAIQRGERNGLLKHTPLHDLFFSLSLHFCFCDGLGFMRRTYFSFAGWLCALSLSVFASHLMFLFSISVCYYIYCPYRSHWRGSRSRSWVIVSWKKVCITTCSFFWPLRKRPKSSAPAGTTILCHWETHHLTRCVGWAYKELVSPGGRRGGFCSSALS